MKIKVHFNVVEQISSDEYLATVVHIVLSPLTENSLLCHQHIDPPMGILSYPSSSVVFSNRHKSCIDFL